jgi:site-specific DNA-methyltransferase (adenine-specific)/modification methylase
MTTTKLAVNRPTRLELFSSFGSAYSAVLWLGDCRDVLPAVAADAVITDPPYGLGDRMKGGTWGAASKYANLREWDKAPTDETVNMLINLAKVCVIWGGNHFRLPESRCWLVWDKQNAVPTMSDVELAWTNIDKPAKRKSLPVGVHQYGHPTEKPLALMAWTLEQAGVTKGTTVLDPYMGTGTTGVAAIRRGCNFIGIERDPTHYKTAVERIRNELNQGVLL